MKFNGDFLEEGNFKATPVLTRVKNHYIEIKIALVERTILLRSSRNSNRN